MENIPTFILGSQDSAREIKFSSNASALVTTSSSTVSDIKKRKILVLTNTSTNSADIITINLGFTPAIAGAGIVLRPGNSYGEVLDQVFEPYGGSIQAVCATANGVLAIMER